MNTTSSCLLALLLAPGALLADSLSFHNGDLITGSITAIDAEGRIVVESPDSPAPLLMRSDTLESAVFDQEGPARAGIQERINLVNGDALPGRVTMMDAREIGLQTWYAGDLKVPRSTVQSIDFGIAPSKLAYQGPGGPEGWLDSTQWKFNGQTATSTGIGTASRPNVLPKNFILRFHLAWEGSPKFRIHFCDDYLKKGGETDRYYFEFNSEGTQLKRQATESGRSYYDLDTSRRRPSSFDNDDVEVEIRVDRTGSIIYVYLDGKLQGRHPDLIGNTPQGKGIMLESNAGRDLKNIIRSLEVYHWDAVSQLHRAEGHEDTTMDALITTDSQRYPGDARELVTEDDERLLILKNPHASELLRVPVRRTSVLYLRHADEDATDDRGATLSLDLSDQGSVQLSEPRLEGDTLSGLHPLLGEISIKRSALKRMRAAESGSADS